MQNMIINVAIGTVVAMLVSKYAPRFFPILRKERRYVGAGNGADLTGGVADGTSPATLPDGTIFNPNNWRM